MIEEPAVSAFSRIWSWQRGYRHARRRGGLIFFRRLDARIQTGFCQG